MNHDRVPASKAPSGRLVAVVLAGGDRDDRLARTVGAASKALVPLRDVPMGAYVATALRASGIVDDVVWVGPTDARVRRLVDVALPAGNRLVDSLTLGLGAAMGRDPSARYLIVTADVPWWDAAGVRAFVRGAPEADLVYPAVAEATARARFPDQKRTFARLADGRFTGGNAVLLTPRAVPALLPFVELAYEARKRPFALARHVGWGMLFSVATGRARLSAIEARVGALLGLDARVFVSDDAAIAADVDHPGHLPATLGLPPLAEPPLFEPAPATIAGT
ncbi:MAG: NTP transferase domain-containing protein [Trueperaceae bacterium]